MDPMGPNWVEFGVLVTIFIFLAGIIYHAGRMSARLDTLESWRNSMRNDMHEISDILGKLSTKMDTLTVLVNERTERRTDIQRVS